MTHSLRAIALTAATVPLWALPALASEPLDPRSLALGGRYSAYSDSDVNGTISNPALLQDQRGWFYLGPNLGFTIGNNAVGVGDVGSLVNYGQYMAQYFNYSRAVTSDPNATVPTAVPVPAAISAVAQNGLVLDLGLRTGLAGLKLPLPSLFGVKLPPSESAPPPKPRTATKANPFAEKGGSILKKPAVPQDGGLAWGAMGVRVWGDGGVDLSLSAPTLFGFVTNFPTLDQTLKNDINDLKTKLQDNSPDLTAITAQVRKIQGDIDGPNAFGALKADPNNPSDNGDRPLTIGETNRAYGTTAITVTQPIPIPKLGWFPRARATVGGAFKLFAAPGTFNPSFGAQGAANSTLPVGAPGTLTTTAKINLSAPLTTLDNALNAFSQDTTKVNQLQQQLSAFGNIDYSKAFTMAIQSKSANSLGSGFDFGAKIDLDDRLSVGASILNPIVIWPGTQTTLTGAYDGHNFSFTQTAQQAINFTDTEPFELSVGAAYRLPLGFNLMADVAQSAARDLNGNGYGPSVQGGIEWDIFHFLYARAGIRLGGPNPVLGFGAGINLALARLDLGLGVDPKVKAVTGGVGLNVGF